MYLVVRLNFCLSPQNIKKIVKEQRFKTNFLNSNTSSVLINLNLVTYNDEFLAIIKAFKTWRQYLKGCKHEVLIFTNYNNFRWLINIRV